MLLRLKAELLIFPLTRVQFLIAGLVFFKKHRPDENIFASIVTEAKERQTAILRLTNHTEQSSCLPLWHNSCT
jgi:hypothetical protein